MVHEMPKPIPGALPALLMVVTCAFLIVVVVGGLIGWSVAGIACGGARLLLR